MNKRIDEIPSDVYIGGCSEEYSDLEVRAVDAFYVLSGSCVDVIYAFG